MLTLADFSTEVTGSLTRSSVWVIPSILDARRHKCISGIYIKKFLYQE
jgi:hypothetical protein